MKALFRRPWAAILATVVGLLTACGGGGSGGGGTGAPEPVLLGDDARRAVLVDLGQQLILPSLQAFATAAQNLSDASALHAAQPADEAARSTARQRWREAAISFQRIEVLQLGPAALSDQPGGEDYRLFIYPYPQRNLCLIDGAAFRGDPVDRDTRVDSIGLGALEHLLFSTGTIPDCPPEAGVDPQRARAEHASRMASFVAQQAAELLDRWAPEGGHFLEQWSSAGTGSMVYGRPQDALDALSTALFYVDKELKDLKIGCPTAIGATGLVCNAPDPARAEFAIARASLPAMRANVQTLRDSFAGLDGGMGINDLLRGIERDDIADRQLAALDAVLLHLDTAISPDFVSAVAQIDDGDACINAVSARQGEPAACALYGLLKAATDIFRTEVVAALSLATPDRAAGDND